MEILQVLHKHILDDKNSSLSNMEIFLTILNNVEHQLNIDRNFKFNEYIACCIDLEGLDGCGKSTLAHELHKKLIEDGRKSLLLTTPPIELLQFRSYFDSQPELIRRAYYNLGNMLVSFQLKNVKDQIIILDRYWPSTIAYQLAKQNENEHMNLSWPTHLVQPLLVIYISIDEIERRRRVEQRTTVPITLEEKQLAEQETFRHRLDMIYRHHIPTSHLHVVNGNRPTNLIADDILNLLDKATK